MVNMNAMTKKNVYPLTVIPLFTSSFNFPTNYKSNHIVYSVPPPTFFFLAPA